MNASLGAVSLPPRTSTPPSSLQRRQAPGRRGRSPKILLASLFVAVAPIPGLRHWLPGGVLPEQAVLAGVVVLFPPVIGSLRRLPASVRPGVALASLWLAWGTVVSAVRSPDLGNSVRITVWQAGALVIACIVTSLAGRRRSRTVRRAVVLTGAVASSVGVVAFILNWSYGSFGVVSEAESEVRKASGLSIEPNLYASAAAVALALYLADAMPGRRMARLLVVTALGLGILLSFTRAAWIAIGVAVAVSAVGRSRARRAARVRSRRYAFAVMLVTSAAVGLSGDVRDALIEKSSSIVDFGSGTGAYRRETLRLAIDDIDGPVDIVVGLGVNSFGHRHEEPTGTGVPAYLSNIALVVMYDGGLVGLGLFVGALWQLDRAAARERARKQFRTVLAVALICSLATNAFWFGFVWTPIILVASYGIASSEGRRAIWTPAATAPHLSASSAVPTG